MSIQLNKRQLIAAELLGVGHKPSDLAKKLDIPIILVIKNKLGCINHTLLTIEMIESLKLNLKLIIFNRFNKEDDSHFEELKDFVKNYDIYNWQGQDFHPEILKKL